MNQINVSINIPIPTLIIETPTNFCSNSDPLFLATYTFQFLDKYDFENISTIEDIQSDGIYNVNFLYDGAVFNNRSQDGKSSICTCTGVTPGGPNKLK